MTSNNPITHGKRARKKTNQFISKRLKESRIQVKELFGAASEEIKSQNLNPIAEMVVAKVTPLASSEITKIKQNNQQNDGERQNIGVFTTTTNDDEQEVEAQGDDDDDEQEDDAQDDEDCERQ